MIVFYTTHCPRCRVLKYKLDEKGVEYVENEDVDEMISKGYQAAPILEVDGVAMMFGDAVRWVGEQ